ncbi:hypothetical protein [Aestuariibacter sp. A3R04]|uniref:hypothetical protein n=1 Tax=Aestuariibacter sp. A3R04 TaxID=2841571 RepID=UPI001C08605F|nr:hypothetical protein [Aestuariibacter sp. A3R04]MBU3020636.1 hypothetical protein [Aestuariibacter sp. A3R04]
MKTQNSANEEQRKQYIGIVSIIVFALLMGMLIVHLYEEEPNLKKQLLGQFGKKLEDSAISAHWQWRAEGNPEMIMLVHYNLAGKETDRRPVRMGLNGWPKVERTSEGCKKLWQMLLNQPMEVDGFRVHGEYYRADHEDDETDNAYCRYRLSAGDYFDYAVSTGDVTFKE